MNESWQKVDIARAQLIIAYALRVKGFIHEWVYFWPYVHTVLKHPHTCRTPNFYFTRCNQCLGCDWCVLVYNGESHSRHALFKSRIWTFWFEGFAFLEEVAGRTFLGGCHEWLREVWGSAMWPGLVTGGSGAASHGRHRNLMTATSTTSPPPVSLTCPRSRPPTTGC